MIILSVSKLLSLLRMYPRFSKLVKSILVVLHEMAYFLAFFWIFCFVFGILNIVAGITFDDGDYPDINFFWFQSITSFRNSLGDLQSPDYSYWRKDKKGPIETFMVYYSWVLFNNQIIFMVVVLLNFLLGIITQSYE